MKIGLKNKIIEIYFRRNNNHYSLLEYPAS